MKRPTSQQVTLTENDSNLVHPISVVVCTRDRPQALQCCLQSLQQLDGPTYEVIVVDNASRDNQTAQIVAATPFRYIRENRPGLDWARNRGAAEAQYDLIAYVDDDVRVSTGWLCGLAQAFADPEVAIVTGLVLPAELDTPAQQLFEQYSGMGKGEQRRYFLREMMSDHQLIAVHQIGVGANMAFRRCVFETLGGFDTALDVGTPAGGGGDLEMFHRVLATGFTLCYEPTALVWHQHRRNMTDLRRQLYYNGRSFGVYLINVYCQHGFSRIVVVDFAVRWMIGWLLARLLNCLLGRLRFPLNLVWAELWGACHAPWAYRATLLHDHAIRRHYGEG